MIRRAFSTTARHWKALEKTTKLATPTLVRPKRRIWPRHISEEPQPGGADWRAGKPAPLEDNEPVATDKPPMAEDNEPDSSDPNDSDLLRDELKGETTEHAKPPRLEDEGQSGG
jgi:hypothetical protein